MEPTTTLQDEIKIGTLYPVGGFRACGVSAGLRKSGRPDLALIVSSRDCAAAGVFTTNQVKAAPVLVDMERLAHDPDTIRAVVTNAANANACTGEEGLHNAERTAKVAAEALGITPEQVLVLSTGVIGVQLPMDRMVNGIPQATGILENNGWLDAATAIMTTDTRPKAASRQLDGYTITGIAKGSGMIAPNMATMLAILTTDAKIPQPLLQQALRDANSVSFNRISVDGDTSTNDSVLLLANGDSGVQVGGGPAYRRFLAALTDICTELAHMIVRDGEGATRFVTVKVSGAPDNLSAHQIANTIGTSPLVKTAIYGGDANWGRVIAAAGRAGVPFDPSRLDLWFSAGSNGQSPLQVVANGTPASYEEEAAAAIFAQREVTILLSVGDGSGVAEVWTCDFSHDYVSINADYRS
ncbi:MAG: bifunctional glutamate N-acetyltransferase/amino-acid acetyltransferase ArgJ [Chloroflexi bacterium]|nr:bifunctional glutamate N-acetyltransferase/amino-acid acetyltransferase ArgJ [Chloroflexota bacterium]